MPNCCKVGRVRFVHNIASASGLPVNIFIDETQVGENVLYREVSDYISVEKGRHTLRVVTVGPTPVTLTKELCVKKGEDYTVVVIGLLSDPGQFPLGLEVFIDDNNHCKKGYAFARFIHGAAGVGPVDVFAGTCVEFENVDYLETACPEYEKIWRGSQVVQVKLAGTETLVFPPFSEIFEKKQVYTLVATGLAGSTDPATAPGLIIFSNPSRSCC